MERMIIPIDLWAFLICWAASIPFSPGMAMSMITMSGSSSLTIRTASRPSPAVPTTRKSGCVSRNDCSPSRNTAWSSARNIVISATLSHPFCIGAGVFRSAVKMAIFSGAFQCSLKRLRRTVNEIHDHARDVKQVNRAFRPGKRGRRFVCCVPGFDRNTQLCFILKVN